MQRLKDWSLATWAAVATLVVSALTVMTFAENAMHNFFGGNYAAVWSSFHPAIKEMLSEDRYIECEQRAGKPASFLSLSFRGIEQAPVDMEGVPPTASLLRYDVTVEVPEGKTTAPVDMLIANDEQLSLLPLQWQYDAYVNGTCPTPYLLTPRRPERRGDQVVP